jgi:DNA-binding transcriptional MerR regulator
MRLSELAEASGVSTASIKYYLRIGLLPPGDQVTRTLSGYEQRHLDRLGLIRALREVGQLPIASIQAILGAVDDEAVSVADLMGVTQAAVARPIAVVTEQGRAAAHALFAELGWSIGPDSPMPAAVGAVLQVLIEQGRPVDMASLLPWAKAAHDLAEIEVGSIPFDAPRDVAANVVAVGAVLYGELLTQLRLAAQESVAITRFGYQEGLQDQSG